MVAIPLPCDSPATIPPTRFYLPELDGLRFLAFGSVFYCHAVLAAPRPLDPWVEATTDAAGFGVDLFFALSSFLLTVLLLRERDARDRISIVAFWIRRALRIWPLYFAFVGTYVIIDQPPRSFVVGLFTFTTNWTLLYERPGSSTATILWSLAVEEQFYLVWPLVLVLVAPRRLPAVCGVMLLLSMLARAALVTYGVTSELAIWLPTVTRLDPLAVGALLAWSWHTRIERGAPRWPAWTPWVTMAVVAGGLTWMFRCWPPFGSSHGYDEVLTYTIAAIGMGTVVLVTILCRSAILGHPAVAYLGRISYGLYVFHVAALDMVNELGPLRWFVSVPLAFGLTVALASGSYAVLEQPFLRLKRRFSYIESAPVTPSAGAMRSAAPELRHRKMVRPETEEVSGVAARHDHTR